MVSSARQGSNRPGRQQSIDRIGKEAIQAVAGEQRHENAEHDSKRFDDFSK